MRSKLIIILSLLIFPVAASTKDTLRLGYVEYPPEISTTLENMPGGPVVDDFNQILGPQFEISWSKIPIGRVRWAFENNIIDAYLFLVRTPEREEWVHFFDKPYTTIQNIICSKKDADQPAELLSSIADDLAGLTLVYPLNNVSRNYPFFNDARVSQIKIEFTNYTERSIGLLNKGRAEYVYFPSRGPLERSGRLNELSCKNLGQRTDLYLAVAKHNKFATRLETIFDAIETREN